MASKIVERVHHSYICENKLHTYKNITSNLIKNRGSAITIGNFDGIHIGHQKLLYDLVDYSLEADLLPTVLTFYPHTREYFNNGLVSRIYNNRDKIRIIFEHGIHQILIKKFNNCVAKTTAESFIENILVKKLKMRMLLIGSDFRFGYKRQGNLETFREASIKYGFEVKIVENVFERNSNNMISSSIIRKFLKDSDLDSANKLLGRKLSISGHVIHGKKIGRELGYPTLNINIPQNYALGKGVYIVHVYGLENNKIYNGVASLGTRETLENNGNLLLEIHVIDGNINVYGKIINVEFLKKIRDEKRFDNIKSLKDAISNDITQARSYFDNNGL